MLTTQERRVLRLVAEGHTNKGIAAVVFLSDKTVKNYVSSILSKLGLQRRAQTAAYIESYREETGSGIHRFDWAPAVFVESRVRQRRLRASAQSWLSSKSGQAAMSTPWFSGDARVHQWGARVPSARRPPASSAAATRASA